MRSRRIFTKEFKEDILSQLEHKPMVEVCREYDLHPTLVTRWKREQRDYPGDAFKGRGRLYKLEAQVAERDRLIGQLYAENALLKKANAVIREKRAEERKRCTK